MPTLDDKLLIPLVMVVLLVRVGMAAYSVGLVRSRHAAATAIRSLLDICFSVLAFAWVGTAFVTPAPNGVVSFNVRELFAIGGHTNGLELIAVVLAGAILPGALAERCGFWASMWAAVAFGAIVLPVPLYWSMLGWINRLDVGSLGIVYPITGAVFALVAARMVGPRANKYHRDGSTGMIPGHNLPLAVVGAMLTIVGFVWLHLVCSYHADHALVAIAAGGVAATIVTQWKFGKPDIGLILTGVLGAAVAVTCAGTSQGWAASIVGIGAGLIVPHVAFELDTRFKIDDPISGVSIFGAGGIWGVLIGGALQDGSIADRAMIVGRQLFAIGAIVAWTAVVGWLVFALLKKFTHLRVREADEFDGLDLAEHDVSAYPDFQQNTIRSFHMREA